MKDFNKFHDRFIPGQNLGLLAGKRAEIAQSGMLVARSEAQQRILRHVKSLQCNARAC